MLKPEERRHMSDGSQVGSQEFGQRRLTPVQEKIATAHQEYRESIGAPSRKPAEIPSASAPDTGSAGKPSVRGGHAMGRFLSSKRGSVGMEFPNVAVTKLPVVPETPIPAPGLAEKPFLRSDSLPSGSLKLALEKYGAKLRAAAEAELKAKSSKESLRGQFLKQVEEIGAGAIDRKAATAEYNAKYNAKYSPYAEKKKADLEADRIKREAVETPPVTPRIATMNPLPKAKRDEILCNMKILSDAEKQAKLRAAQKAAVAEPPLSGQNEQPVVPEESPTPEAEVATPVIEPSLAVTPEMPTPAPATGSTKEPFFPSSGLQSGKMRRALGISGSKVLPGIKALSAVEEQMKLRAAQKAAAEAASAMPTVVPEGPAEATPAPSVEPVPAPAPEAKSTLEELLNKSIGEMTKQEFENMGDLIAVEVGERFEEFYNQAVEKLCAHYKIYDLEELRRSVDYEEYMQYVGTIMKDMYKEWKNKRDEAGKVNPAPTKISAPAPAPEITTQAPADAPAVEAAAAMPVVVPEGPSPDLTTELTETGTDQVNKGREFRTNRFNVIGRLFEIRELRRSAPK